MPFCFDRSIVDKIDSGIQLVVKLLFRVRDDRLHFASELDENGNVAATEFGNGQRVDYSFVHKMRSVQ